MFVPSSGLDPAALTSPRLLGDPTALLAALNELGTTALGPVRAGRLLALGNGLPFSGKPSVAVPNDPGADAVVDAALGPTTHDARQMATLTDLGGLLQLASPDHCSLPR